MRQREAETRAPQPRGNPSEPADGPPRRAEGPAGDPPAPHRRPQRPGRGRTRRRNRASAPDWSPPIRGPAPPVGPARTPQFFQRRVRPRGRRAPAAPLAPSWHRAARGSARRRRMPCGGPASTGLQPPPGAAAPSPGRYRWCRPEVTTAADQPAAPAPPPAQRARPQPTRHRFDGPPRLPRRGLPVDRTQSGRPGRHRSRTGRRSTPVRRRAHGDVGRPQPVPRTANQTGASPPPPPHGPPRRSGAGRGRSGPHRGSGRATARRCAVPVPAGRRPAHRARCPARGPPRRPR